MPPAPAAATAAAHRAAGDLDALHSLAAPQLAEDSVREAASARGGSSKADRRTADDEEAEAAAVIMPDGTAVPSAKGPVQVQPKRKKSGAGKATKKLLKHLRKIAEVAHDAGLM